MQHIQSILEDRIRAAIAATLASDAIAMLPGELPGTLPGVRPSTHPRFGDYQANVAMGLAKQLKRKPREVAQQIVDHLDVAGLCEKVEIAGPGFINLHLTQQCLSDQAGAMAADQRLGVARADRPETVVVDYSAPNVAKELHVGHIRSTCIGDAIVRVLEYLGHRVIRQNHLGDWGTQFGMLVELLTDQGWEAGGKQHIADLDELYRQAQRRFEADATFAERGRQRVVALQAGDKPTLKIWKHLIDESMLHFNAVYRRLGVLLVDGDVCGESFYNPMLADVVADLEAKGLATLSDGAMCVFPPGFVNREGEPAAMIVRKSDGGYLYATTDVAAVRYRVETLKATRLIYVTDSRQAQHHAMVFKAAELAGWLPDTVRAEHVPFGTILGKDSRPFKTREGGTVKLADLLDEAEQRAAAIITEKNPDLSADQRQVVARAVGIGAIKYGDLSGDRVKDYVFDWDRMLAFDGNTAPYLQNAYVRIQSIFRKGEIDAGVLSDVAITVADPAERALVLKLLQLPETVAAVADALEPHRLCNYLYEVASLYHQFYERCPVLKADSPALRDSRLRLSDLTARALAQGLHLLGIETLERM